MKQKILSIGAVLFVILAIVLVSRVVVLNNKTESVGKETVQAQASGAFSSFLESFGLKKSTSIPSTTSTTNTTKSISPTGETLTENTSTTNITTKTVLPTKTSTISPSTNPKASLPTIAPGTKIEPSATTNSDWRYVGAPGFSTGEVWYSSLAIDSNNVPYVAYSAMALDYGKITVMKFNSINNNWVNVGNPEFAKVNSEGSDGDFVLKINSNNIPYLAFKDYLNSNKITVKKFDSINNIWVNVGNSGFSAGEKIRQVALTFNTNNIPYVAFEDWFPNAPFERITVMKFNGTNWVNVGTPGFTPVEARSPSLVIDSNNIPYVSFVDNVIAGSSQTYKITVMKFNGTNWENVGNPRFSSGNVTVNNQTLAVDSNNILYVGYSDKGTITPSFYGKATVKKFNGVSWVDVGAPNFLDKDVGWLRIALDSYNNPYIEARYSYDKEMLVMRFNGNTWINVGEPGFSGSNMWGSSPFELDSDDIPYVAYQNSNDYKAIVMRYIVPSLTILSPNGGEKYLPNDVLLIKWKSLGFLPTDTLYFDLVKQDNTNTVYHLNQNNPTPNSGSKTFLIPSNVVPGEYKVYGKFSNFTTSDYSDNNFTIEGWAYVGTQGFSSSAADNISVALDNNNNPYIAYRLSGQQAGLQAMVKKWNGTSWADVGVYGFSGASAYLSLNIDSNNIPYLAYQDAINGYKTTALKWNGTNWIPVGSRGFSQSRADQVSIDFDSSNNPYVVYREYLDVDGKKAIVKKWNGTNWISLGSSVSNGPIDNLSFAIGTNNIPYVAYLDGSNYYADKITVKKWNGTSWEIVGASKFSAAGVNCISLALDSNNIPYVAYTAYSNNSKPSLMKFDGANWVYVGGTTFLSTSVASVSLDFNSDNRPIIAYRDEYNGQKASVRKWDGYMWQNLGSVGFSAGIVTGLKLSVGSNNVPYVGYTDHNSSDKASVMKYW